MASEDIGLADPRALRLALDAAETYERLGSPEGELALAEAVVYLAMAPKSNAVYSRLQRGARLRQVATAPGRCRLRLRNAPTSLMKSLDYGKGYRYAHDEAGALRRRRALLARRPRAAALLRAGRARPRDPIGERLAELRALNDAPASRSDFRRRRASPSARRKKTALGRTPRRWPGICY
jgi:putative ATPase